MGDNAFFCFNPYAILKVEDIFELDHIEGLCILEDKTCWEKQKDKRKKENC